MDSVGGASLAKVRRRDDPEGSQVAAYIGVARPAPSWGVPTCARKGCRVVFTSSGTGVGVCSHGSLDVPGQRADDWAVVRRHDEGERAG